MAHQTERTKYGWKAPRGGGYSAQPASQDEQSERARDAYHLPQAPAGASGVSAARQVPTRVVRQVPA